MRTIPLGLTGSFLAITALSGCLGSNNVDFTQQAVDAAMLLGEFQSLPATGVNEMPETATVVYTGTASFSYDEQLQTGDPTSFDLLSDVTITADFDTNDVTGDFTNFNSRDGNVEGTVTLDDGAVAGNLMAANASGTIVDGDVSTDMVLDVNGIFRGPDGQAISGGMSGSYVSDDGSSGEMFGLFGVDSN